MMLRHPSFYQRTRREEGCSSTAIRPVDTVGWTAWINLADRGSVQPTVSTGRAVP